MRTPHDTSVSDRVRTTGPPRPAVRPSTHAAGPWRKLDLLAVALPAAVVARLLGAPTSVVFTVSALAVVPFAGMIGRATEVLAERVGGSTGALLNATFGNIAELVLGTILLLHGQATVVKASLTGSFIGNLLLLLGVALVVSGYDQVELPMARKARGQATMLFLAVGILVLPTVFGSLPQSSPSRLGVVSDVIAVVLFVVYGLGLLFTLRTHRALFRSREDQADEQGSAGDEDAGRAVSRSRWSPRGAVIVLAVATAFVAVAAELVSATVQTAGSALGLHAGFLGFVVLPVVGNAAEQFSALSLAVRDRLDVAADIAMGASIQVVMLVIPLLVLVGVLSGHHLNLQFSVLELTALGVSTLLARQLVDDEKGNWLEGVMLLGLYVAFAATVFFLPL